MTISPTSRKLYKAISLPTGKVESLVCVGNLPSYDYKVQIGDKTEDVTTHLEAHPELPGVILLDGKALYGCIPRERQGVDGGVLP